MDILRYCVHNVGILAQNRYCNSLISHFFVPCQEQDTNSLIHDIEKAIKISLLL